VELEDERQLIDHRKREMFDSGIGGTLAAAHQKVAFCLFAWAPIDPWALAFIPRGKLMAALVACFCPPFTRFLEALSFFNLRKALFVCAGGAHKDLVCLCRISGSKRFF
jgi:hypothetical protein